MYVSTIVSPAAISLIVTAILLLNWRYVHEIDPNSKSVTKDDRSENRSFKPSSRGNRSSNSKSNNNNKHNNNNTSISNNNSQQSHAHLNRLQAQEEDFQSWSNVNSQGYRNASLNTLSFKRKRLHREAAIEEERQKEIEWDITNSPSPRSRRRRNRRGRSETPSPQPSPKFIEPSQLTAETNDKSKIKIHYVLFFHSSS